MPSMRTLKLCCALAVVLCSAQAQTINSNLYSGMRWRMIGPFRGGRSLTAAGVPGQRDVYYFGAVGGGVWKTTNGGETWFPIFDSQPIASIGSVAVAPSDPNIIYVGTGEASIRSDISFGDGVYRSTDAGKTWQHIGLEDTRHIGRVLVDPKDPRMVLIAALGHAYGPNAERGVFRSTDSGDTWQKVLFKDENTGAIDLAFDPENSKIVYATLWNAHRPPWSTYAPVQGPGSGLYKSTDGGATWSQISGNGLPAGDWGRVGIATVRSTVYALIDMLQGRDGGLYRSDDRGATWRRVSSDRRIFGRQWYFGEILTAPNDPETVYIPNVSLYRSTDGGKTFEAIKGAPGGDDYHFLWIDPGNAQRMIVASDQGTVISVDGGKSWTSWFNQPTAQFYHVTTDNHFPYYVYGAQQDSGTVATLSRSDYGSITYRDWYSVGGGEAGYIAPDPSDPGVVYAGDTYGRLSRFTKRTGQSQDISPTAVSQFGQEINARKLRFTWTSPVVFSPQDPRTLYMGAQYVLRTRNQGMSWEQISPDLTGCAAPAQSGSTQPAANQEPLTPANTVARCFGVVYTIAPSPLDANVIWAGTDTGKIWVTRDGGKTWANVTYAGAFGRGPAISAGVGQDWSKISMLEASHFDAGTAYAAVDRHRLDDYTPALYRTRDFGKSWERLGAGIAAPAFVRAVREDPARKGLLYAGTELGVYVSFDDGAHWQSLQLNMPTAPVHDLVVHADDLVVATHGRSFWILDDLTPLRQINAQVAAAPAFLFQPQKTYRVRSDVGRDTPLPPEFPVGQNPPSGAMIDYYLGAPANEVTLEILDSAGKSVRRYSSSDKPGQQEPVAFPTYWFLPPQTLAITPGMHRFIWDLRYPSPRSMVHQYEIAAAFGAGVPVQPRGPLAVPGEYQVRLTAGGRTYTQRLALQMDPRVSVSPEDLRKQVELELQISAALDQVYDAVQQVRQVRAQLKNLASKSPAQEALDHDAAALEGGPGMRGESLSRMNGGLAALLHVVDTADHAPTQQAQQEWQELRQAVDALLRRVEELKSRSH